MTSTGIKLRPVTRNDYKLLEKVHQAAFAKSEFGYGGEGDLARQLHENGDALVSLFAEAWGKVIGHVMFSNMQVEADGQPLLGAFLAPVGVVPEWQGQGVGSLLINAGLAALKPQGTQISMAVGNSNYYQRFGYSVEQAQPFESFYTGPYFMALLLDPSLSLPKTGKAEFAAPFASF